MRRSGFAGERFGERTLARKQNRRRLPGELIEVANEMCLIVVTAFDGYIRPRGIALLDCAKHVLKPDDSRQQLWTNTDFALKTTFELTAADAGIGSELVHRYETAAIDDRRGERE